MISRVAGKLKQQADAEVAAGRLWRAKEVLRNAITSYDADLFESYGRILLQMQDLKEAGKWLFLSGRRQPEYGEAIATFLEWCGSRGAQKLYGSFPGCARLRFVREYPETLAVELQALGVPPEIPSSWGPRQEIPLQGKTLVGCVVVVCFLIASLIVGGVVIVGWLWSWVGIG